MGAVRGITAYDADFRVSAMELNKKFTVTFPSSILALDSPMCLVKIVLNSPSNVFEQLDSLASARHF